MKRLWLIAAVLLFAASARADRLYFSTAPCTANTAGVSLIPQDLPADAYDVCDIITTTNAAYHSDGAGSEWGDVRAHRELAKMAAQRGVPLLIDAEVVWTRPPKENRNALDVWLGDRKRARAANDYTAKLAAAAADAAPGVRFGFYSKLPAFTGMNPGQYDPKDFRALIADESKRLRRLPSFTVVDAYPSVAAGETDADVVRRLERDAKQRLDLADDYAYGPTYRETLLLITDVIFEAGKPEKPVSPDLLRQILALAVKLKTVPAVWRSIQSPEHVPVYQAFSKRAATN